MKKTALILVVLFAVISPAFAVQKAIVIVPVADLRSDQSLPPVGHSDDKQQTQLLYGETVEVVTSSGEWVYVNAIEQPEFTTHQRWEGYPGWVLRKTLSFEEPPPKFLPRKKNESIRTHILERAKQLIGTPYTWGGLSPFDETHKARLSGLDCSGLVHLTYRVSGLSVPRDSMEQYMKAEKIRRKDLKPADLVFSAKADKPEKIVHVALYEGDGQLIEAPQTGMVVRKISFKDKYGRDFLLAESGDTIGDRVVYFGRLIKD